MELRASSKRTPSEYFFQSLNYDNKFSCEEDDKKYLQKFSHRFVLI